ncbi:GNAT family N-acetyltransferase [Burkholderiaceae bacterium UC74_6]
MIDIQACCYDAAKLESAQSFLAKVQASPASCFMAWIDDRPAGYLVAMPADAQEPPPLHGETYAVPAGANSLYLHDLSVHPGARGKGVAEALVRAFFQARLQLDLRFACLTAVNGSSGFWAPHGFRPVAETDALASCLAGYGDGARYMRQEQGA